MRESTTTHHTCTTNLHHPRHPRQDPLETQQDAAAVACLRRSGPLRTERRALRGRLACLCRPLFSTQPTHSSERSPCPAAAACLALPAFHSCQPLELLDSRPPLSLSHPRCCDSCPPRHSCADGLAWTRADLLDTLVYFIFFLPRSVLVAPAFLVVPVVSVIPILHLTLAFVVTLAILAASFSSFPSLPFAATSSKLSQIGRCRARAHTHPLLWLQSYPPASRNKCAACLPRLPELLHTSLPRDPARASPLRPHLPQVSAHGLLPPEVPHHASPIYLPTADLPTLPLPLPLRPDSGALLITSGLLLCSLSVFPRPAHHHSPIRSLSVRCPPTTD